MLLEGEGVAGRVVVVSLARLGAGDDPGDDRWLDGGGGDDARLGALDGPVVGDDAVLATRRLHLGLRTDGGAHDVRSGHGAHDGARLGELHRHGDELLLRARDDDRHGARLCDVLHLGARHLLRPCGRHHPLAGDLDEARADLRHPLHLGARDHLGAHDLARLGDGGSGNLADLGAGHVLLPVLHTRLRRRLVLLHTGGLALLGPGDDTGAARDLLRPGDVDHLGHRARDRLRDALHSGRVLHLGAGDHLGASDDTRLCLVADLGLLLGLGQHASRAGQVKNAGLVAPDDAGLHLCAHHRPDNAANRGAENGARHHVGDDLRPLDQLRHRIHHGPRVRDSDPLRLGEVDGLGLLAAHRVRLGVVRSWRRQIAIGEVQVAGEARTPLARGQRQQQEGKQDAPHSATQREGRYMGISDWTLCGSE